jgi:hypothetical protein
VAHALTAHLGPRDLDAAALADDALVADALVLAAVALPVLGRTEDALAEEAVLLRLERAVVDRLRLVTSPLDHDGSAWRTRADLDRVEVVDVDHRCYSSSQVGLASAVTTSAGRPRFASSSVQRRVAPVSAVGASRSSRRGLPRRRGSAGSPRARRRGRCRAPRRRAGVVRPRRHLGVAPSSETTLTSGRATASP